MKDEEHEEIKAFIAGAVNNVARYCYAHQNPDPDDPRTGWRTVKDWVKVIDAKYDEEIRGIKPAPPAEPKEAKGIVETVVGAPKVVFESTFGKLGGTLKSIGKKLIGVEETKSQESA